MSQSVARSAGATAHRAIIGVWRIEPPMESSVGQPSRHPQGAAALSFSPSLCEPLEPRTLLSAAWGATAQLIGQDKAAAAYPAAVGAGESIAIIDTGIDYTLAELGGGFGPGHKVVGGYDFVNNDADPMDSDGHGTGVASIAAGATWFYNGQRYQGVAPGADLIALRVDDGIHDPPAKRIGLALQWVLDHRAQYNIVSINISEGDGHFTHKTPQSVYGDKLAALAAAGVFV